MYSTIKVDEKYTTMMHFKCKRETCGIEQDRKNIRGLRWCATLFGPKLEIVMHVKI
jgi:hypothetical protein